MSAYMEKRKHKRVHTHLITTRCRKSGENDFFELESDDISEGGMRVLTRRKFTPGDPLNLVLILPGYRDTIELAGEIAWIQPSSASTNRFEAGIKFPEINDRLQYLLREFVDTNSAKDFVLNKLK